MAAQSKSKPTPRWIIDLHGIKEALTTRSNAKARILDAIQSGEMIVLRSVQHELKNLYEDLWPDFVAIKGKKYVDTTVAVSAVAAQLQETHGSSVLGGVPSFAHFEAVALARTKKLKLVSAGKGLKDCKQIASNCGLPVADIVGISAV
jgi:hypothetical protein